jgi:hypothetical protein
MALTRRRIFAAAATAAVTAAVAPAAARRVRAESAALAHRTELAPSPDAVEVLPGLWIRPREAWGADLPPRGPVVADEAKFILVHHTASTNNYSSARQVIRNVYAFQTGSAKRWNDVCYQFFIGRDGDVWEGRAGALAGPVMADATGGSQGFAQLICLLGDFSTRPPTQPAIDSLIRVLAWLSGRYGIDIATGASTTFVSRGSQRWSAGTPVTTPTIAGHRDMSYTECPGSSLYSLLPIIRLQAIDQREAWKGVLKPARRIGPQAERSHPSHSQVG